MFMLKLIVHIENGAEDRHVTIKLYRFNCHLNNKYLYILKSILICKITINITLE